MSEDERLKRIEAAALLSLLISANTAATIYKRDRWKRELKDALWPLL